MGPQECDRCQFHSVTTKVPILGSNRHQSPSYWIFVLKILLKICLHRERCILSVSDTDIIGKKSELSQKEENLHV